MNAKLLWLTFLSILLTIILVDVFLGKIEISLPTSNNIWEISAYSMAIPFKFVTTFNSIVPLWLSIPFVYIPVIMIALTITKDLYFFIYADTEGEGVQISDMPYWIGFGEALKLAYSAKFGGENLGFNDEIDKRVKMMTTLKDGITRRIAKDYLKRMRDFTEAQI